MTPFCDVISYKSTMQLYTHTTSKLMTSFNKSLHVRTGDADQSRDEELWQQPKKPEDMRMEEEEEKDYTNVNKENAGCYRMLHSYKNKSRLQNSNEYTIF